MGWIERLQTVLHRIFQGSLRARILSWIFIPTVIILAAVALVNLYAYRQVTADLVVERDQELARLYAGQLGTEFKEYTNLLDSITRMDEFQGGDARLKRAALKETRNRTLVFDAGVVVLDNFGTVLAAEPERPDAIGMDWSDRAFFRQIARDTQPAFSNILPDGEAGVVAAGVPIIGANGEFQGVLAGMFRIGASAVSSFYGEIVMQRIGEGARTYLVDGNGLVIYHTDFDQIGANFSGRPVVQLALFNQVGTIRARDREGRDILAAFAPVSGTPWYLITEADWGALGGEHRSYQNYLLLLLVLGLLVPLGVVAVGMQRITRPLEELIRAAGEVARGEFGRTLPVYRDDEIGELTDQFNRMSSRLQESYAFLEERVAERTQELEALYAADEELIRHLRVGQVLQTLVDVAVDRLHADKSSLMVWDDAHEKLVVRASRGFSPETLAVMEFAPGDGIVSEVAARGLPFVIEDTQTSEKVAARITSPEGIRSFMHFPIKVDEQVFGVFNVSYLQPRAFGADEQRLFSALAQRAALAIENAHLYKEEQVRRRELQTLLAVASTASSSLDLDEMLISTLDLLITQVGAARAGVMLQEERSSELELAMLRPQTLRLPFNLEELTHACQDVIASGEARLLAPNPGKGLPGSVALLPLRVRGRTLGVLVIIGSQGEQFSKGQLALFQSIADQLGVAVENASLYERAEQVAVAAERSRLARELHDAVTQTLFSASLIAEVLPRLWEKNPAEGRRRLEEIRELNRGALAEMRTLLLELRPAALADAPLSDLLKQLSEAFTSRARITPALEIEGHCSLPLDVKVAFYRIAQEALNNTFKHAVASQVSIRLRCSEEEICLRLEDNGHGFAEEAFSPDHLGLGIMQERAEAIHAELKIDSQPGRGTSVEVRLKLDPQLMNGVKKHA